MLVTLDKIRQQVAGKHPAIDAWLNVRRNLLVEYMQLAGLMPPPPQDLAKQPGYF